MPYPRSHFPQTDGRKLFRSACKFLPAVLIQNSGHPHDSPVPSGDGCRSAASYAEGLLLRCSRREWPGQTCSFSFFPVPARLPAVFSHPDTASCFPQFLLLPVGRIRCQSTGPLRFHRHGSAVLGFLFVSASAQTIPASLEFLHSAGAAPLYLQDKSGKSGSMHRFPASCAVSSPRSGAPTFSYCCRGDDRTSRLKDKSEPSFLMEFPATVSTSPSARVPHPGSGL